MFKADPLFKKKSIAELNSEAVAFLKRDDDLRCVGAFAKLFRKLMDNHLVHKDLHVCHSNRAAAYLNLGLHEEALWDARRCQELAEQVRIGAFPNPGTLFYLSAGDCSDRLR